MAKASIYSFFMGIITAVWQVDVRTGEGWTQATLACNTLILVLFLLLAWLLREKRQVIH